ncbi:MAG: hypothetical protein HWD84_08120 [Flavobacteriaceae bacterium]|nr:hypothetical protein [Flavobacteriaceae bacterium]
MSVPIYYELNNRTQIGIKKLKTVLQIMIQVIAIFCWCSVVYTNKYGSDKGFDHQVAKLGNGSSALMTDRSDYVAMHIGEGGVFVVIHK